MRMKKTSLLTKLLLAVVAIYALVTLVNLQDRVNEAKTQINDLE